MDKDNIEYNISADRKYVFLIASRTYDTFVLDTDYWNTLVTHKYSVMYPENWTLNEAETDSLPRIVHLDSPDGAAIWEVQLHDAGVDATEILDAGLKTLRETYPDLEVSTTASEFDGAEQPAYEALFFCLDFLIRVKLQTLVTPDHLLVFWYQAEDRHFDEIEMVFQAISTSLRQSL